MLQLLPRARRAARAARTPFVLAASLALVTLARAQGPAGYYDTVDDTSPAALRASLHALVDDHARYPYTSSATDTWDILEQAFEDPADPGRILDVYRNASHPKQGGGNTFYNREHPWPNSYGFPDDNSGNYPFTDCHVLFLCDPSYNSSRGNKPYRFGSALDSERPTVLNDGMGGGTGTYPGNSNWTTGQSTSGGWETWVGRRGDVARALLYMDVRYEGGTHGVTGHWEPDLILTDDLGLVAASSTGNNEAVAYMGLLSDLLAWHAEDPPDAFELRANDVVATYQGNRNPFVDHPEWVDCLFGGACSGVGQVFCAGDGSAAACPCGNAGAPGAGCEHSFGTGGELAAAGTASVVGDTLVLSVEGLPPSTFALFFQGDAQEAAGQGSAFGDGLRCVAGAVLRLGTRGVSGGAASYPGPGDDPVSVRGQLPPTGGLRHYQTWYRNTAAFCTPEGFNFTNGLSLTWAP